MTWSRRFWSGCVESCPDDERALGWGPAPESAVEQIRVRNRLLVRTDEGARVQGVGPGTILGGRYFLRRRLTQGRDVERWSAHDTTLARTIALTIVDAEHPNRAGILDAARRAAGVEDARLVRILDVGSQDGNSYFVEEGMDGALSLTTLLTRGPLPAEEARRVVGEVASGLETARQRGLHHLRLTPHLVLRAPDGAIKVSGVAVAAAIDGPDDREPDPAAASRLDAICVVALAYAALTGRWPLDDKVIGIEPAPRVVGGVPAPSEIAAGVPADLDALCRMTLNEDTGPLTPGDFASQIAPWSRAQVHRVEVEPTIVEPTIVKPTIVIATHDLPTHDVTPPVGTPRRTLPAAPSQASQPRALRPGPRRGVPGRQLGARGPPERRGQGGRGRHGRNQGCRCCCCRSGSRSRRGGRQGRLLRQGGGRQGHHRPHRRAGRRSRAVGCLAGRWEHDPAGGAVHERRGRRAAPATCLRPGARRLPVVTQLSWW